MTRWKVYEKQSSHQTIYSKFDDELAIIVTATSDFRLSKAAYSALQSPDYVLLMSSDDGFIGVAPCRENDENGYKYNKKENRISTKPFVREHNLRKHQVLKAALVEGRLIADTNQDFISAKDGK